MHPILFHIGNFALPTYGVLAAAGLMLGILINVHLAKLEGQDEELLWNGSVVAVVGALLGAKIMLISTDWGNYSHNFAQIFTLQYLRAAGVWYGGLLGGVIAGILYMRHFRMPIMRILDAYTPGISFGHAIGKLGCFFAGCCYGRPSDAPWAVVFTSPVANKLSGTPLEVPLHPAQLYEFSVELVLTLGLLLLWRRRRFPGQVLGTYLFLFGIARYFLEFYRDDPERGSMFGGFMTGTQFISILLVIAGGALWMWRGGLYLRANRQAEAKA